MNTKVAHEFLDAISIFESEVASILSKTEKKIMDEAQEVRLRMNAPLTISTRNGNFFVTKTGRCTTKNTDDLFICRRGHLEDNFLKICDFSIHTHQNEIVQGFVSSKGGYRVGIGGTGVLQGEKVSSLREITSICLRIARSHDGCADDLLTHIVKNGRVSSVLICGEPSSGKSSILKDLAYQLTCGNKYNYRVCVVDERGELSVDEKTANCDVIKMIPKAIGTEMAVRSLAPEIIIFDELGTKSEAEKVLEALNSGVNIIATAHCKDKETLLNRPQLREVIENRVFEEIIFLHGREKPGKIKEILKASDFVV